MPHTHVKISIISVLLSEASRADVDEISGIRKALRACAGLGKHIAMHVRSRLVNAVLYPCYLTVSCSFIIPAREHLS